MLCLTRRIDQRIMVFHELDPTPLIITTFQGNGSGYHFGTQVKLQFEGAQSYKIYREEIYKRITGDGNL